MSEQPQRVVEMFYTIAELTFLLRFSDSYIRQRVRDGVFPGALDIDGDLRVPASAVNAWLAQHPVRYDAGIKARNKAELRRRMGKGPNV